MQNENQNIVEENFSEPLKSTEEIQLEKIEELQIQIDSFKNQLSRKVAEFDNYKKRVDSEQINLIKFANERLITQFLPLLEDFSRIIKSSDEHSESEQFFKGVELVYTKLIKLFEQSGLQSFESLGQEFNTDLHEAIMLTPKLDVAPNIIVEEIEKGYTLHGKVIRHAKVIVSTLPESQEQI